MYIYIYIHAKVCIVKLSSTVQAHNGDADVVFRHWNDGFVIARVVIPRWPNFSARVIGSREFLVPGEVLAKMTVNMKQQQEYHF